ncbi:hypothetical protein [Salmonella enterica]|uniref:hypothetical protein n=1 Tax=Salmonella enterica TaxID=28901 RepID=UPI0009AD7B67|nr:hypothetical protein [Salmonella enterica]
MALSNTQLYAIFDKAVLSSHWLLAKNSIVLKRAYEKTEKIHARGFYFGDESISNLKNPKADPFHIYIISPDNKTRQDEFSLVIYPFVATKIIPIISCIPSVELGYVQLSSNFNAFKVHDIKSFKKYSGVGYSLKVDCEESVWRLIAEIKTRLMLPRDDPKRLSSIHQSNLPKTKEDKSSGCLVENIYLK